MGELTLKDFIEKYNKDKETFSERFNELNNKIDNIENKFQDVDKAMTGINKRISDVEDMQSFLFNQVGGFKEKLDNVKIYLTSIETKLNEYKTLNIQGSKILNGEFYTLKVRLQKVKPIINWENNTALSGKYQKIEKELLELEEQFEQVVD